MRRLLATAGILACMAPSLARADLDADLAISYCTQTQDQINLLVDYTLTKCLPGKDPGGMSFIYISTKPIFEVEAAKKAWLLVVVASFGLKFNSVAMPSDSPIVSDVSLMKNRMAYRIPSALARKLQRQVHDGEIGLDEMYRQIVAGMSTYSVQK